jgi:hypothetical protein
VRPEHAALQRIVMIMYLTQGFLSGTIDFMVIASSSFATQIQFGPLNASVRLLRSSDGRDALTLRRLSSHSDVSLTSLAR